MVNRTAYNTEFLTSCIWKKKINEKKRQMKKCEKNGTSLSLEEGLLQKKCYGATL